MADKQISALTEATEVNTDDLFVLQQNNQAKKLTGQTLITELAGELDGHGGIVSITLTSTEGLAKTYTITFADATTTAFTVMDGERGYPGEQTYVHIRYSAAYPVQTILTTPNVYIGIYAGTSSTAPANSAQYTWYLWKGQQGDTGNGITSITKTGTSGDVDTYTVTLTNGATQTFTVTNGSSIASITKTSTSGLTDTYTVTLTDGSISTFQITNAKSISGIALISGNHAAGTNDTYRITYNDGDTFDFSVYNGANGTGAVSTVAGIPVVGDNGDVPLIIIQNSAPTTSTVGYVHQLLYDTTGGVLYVCTDDTGGSYTWRGASITVDSALSSSSTNPVQNQVIYAALANKVPTSRTVNSKALTSDITLSASDVGAVPTSRTINGAALTSNITTQLKFSNLSVANSAWITDVTYTGYNAVAIVACTGVTADMFPEVVFSPADVESGNFAPVAQATAGGVAIYAKDIPSGTITIPSIIVFT